MPLKKRSLLTWSTLATLVTVLTVTLLLRSLPVRPSTTRIAHEDINTIVRPVCKFVTPPSGKWSYNSRSLCEYPTACLSSSGIHLPTTIAPVCQLSDAAWSPHPALAPTHCEPEWHARVTCAFPDLSRRIGGLIRNEPPCEKPNPLPDTPPTLRNVVFVPKYPYPANIYHFANGITTLAHVLSLRFPDDFTIVFHGSENRNPWQYSLLQVTIARIRERHPGLKVHFLEKGETICAESVVALGKRGHVNVWPFPNSTVVTPDAQEVPIDSVAFREAFYKAYDIRAKLPTEQDRVVGTPPLVLGYARRLGPGAATGGNVHAIGTKRRFSEDDEEWFQSMLEEEAALHGVQLRIFTTNAEDSLRDQVSNFASLGAVIGIHGANLVNSIFMPPLSALIEVFPTDVTSLCYYAGSNSGLKYIRFESDDPATAEESGCFEGRCTVVTRQRRVKIARKEERVKVRDAVKKGLSYLVDLKRRFPNGVPVTPNISTGMYRVVQ